MDQVMLADRVRSELIGNILPFWSDIAVDHERGGIHGEVRDDLSVDDSVPRTAVVCARVLWAFAASARVLGDPHHLATANLAYDYLLAHFVDPVHGGLFWSVDAEGAVIDDRKQVYAQAFAVYALAEYARASGLSAPLQIAADVVRLIERHGSDPLHGGYIEACARDWGAIADMRLSPKDLNAPKSMNTLLHVMEAYTAYVETTGDGAMRGRLSSLVTTILDHVVDTDAGCFRLFFDLEWTPLAATVSYGHDIEGAWLLVAAATAVGDPVLLRRAEAAALSMADAVHQHGRDPDGAILYEFEPGDGVRDPRIDTDSHWWAQAEGAVGFLDAYRISGDERFLNASHACWQFIEDHHIDRVNGDWFKVLDGKRRPRAEYPKVGSWECPYHHVRACLELIQRLSTDSDRKMPAMKTKTMGELRSEHEQLLARPNAEDPRWYNGIYARYSYPVLSAAHAPLEWRYDLNPETNPLGLERLGVNAILNPGAIELDGKILLVCRIEGSDRKSFFAVAESTNGIDGFRFWEAPVVMPETELPDTNVYDMRLVRHEDGWIYGLFCTERKDRHSASLSAATAQAGLARTRDLRTWERLPDLVTSSPQQRNVVLHPEFVDGKYAFYTRPQDDFITAGSGGGIGWGLAETMESAQISQESVIEPRAYHTITEEKNGEGPAPIRTEAGWLHLAHGVRTTAAGLRYVLYLYLSALDEPWRVTHKPGGYFIAPEFEERVGDVSNVVFANGWVARPDGSVLIYYASSDTRVHVATSTIERLLDYVLNTPPDGLRSAASVQQRLELIEANRAVAR